MPSSKDSINGIFSDVFGSSFTLASCSVIARKQCTWAANPKDQAAKSGGFRAATTGKLVLLAQWKLKVTEKSWPLAGTIEFNGGDAICLSLTLNFKTFESAESLDDLYHWFAQLTRLDKCQFDVGSQFSAPTDNMRFPEWNFRRITLEFSIVKGADGKQKLKFEHLSIDSEIHFQMDGANNSTVDLLFLLTFTYRAGGKPFLQSTALEASLWLGTLMHLFMLTLLHRHHSEHD